VNKKESNVDTKCKAQCYPYVVAICDYNGVAVCASPGSKPKEIE